MARLPFLKFFPNDWLAEPALRVCSVAARGLWMDMLSLMHLSARRGYLLATSGKPLAPDQLARLTGCSADEVSRLLAELQSSGVFSCTDDGTIYCRRMVRDEAKREKCSQAGKKGGGSPALKNAGDTGSDAHKIGTFKGHPKGGSKGHPKGGSKPPEARGQITSPSEKSGSDDPASGEPLKPDKNAEAKGKKKDTNANHHPAIRAFCEAWQVKFGKKYPFAGGKDADAVAFVLAAVDNDLSRFESLVERYLASTDKFIVGNGFGLGTLRMRLPELVASEPSASRDERESLRQELFDLVRKEAITLEDAERQFGGPLHDRAAA